MSEDAAAKQYWVKAHVDEDRNKLVNQMQDALADRFRRMRIYGGRATQQELVEFALALAAKRLGITWK